MSQLEEFTSVHHYRITRLIARGGMGAVYEAQQYGVEGFAKTVAVKEILASYASEPEFERLFIGEAKLVADLVHENIVQVYNLGFVDGRYFIVMEYVDGVTLEQFIAYHVERGLPVPMELGAFISSRICRGLEYAHSRTGRNGNELGIVHRDISPKNVLINYEGVVKLTDFGIAKAREVMEQDEEILMGRVEYMSPEQAQRRVTDLRSDIYSVGVLLYELTAGCLPARGVGPLARLHGLGISFATPIREVRADVPPDLSRIIHRALQIDVSSRFQSAGDMGYALEYHLYHKGYGPTNVTLGGYLKRHFTGVKAVSAEDLGTSAVRHRAETEFGDRLAADPPAEG